MLYNKYNIIRKILYLLSLLPLIVLSYRIFSQPPEWITGSMGSINIPLYTTQLIYQFNITQPTNLTFIQFTVPEQVLQQQLYYCKTYDPFVTNNVSPSQCAFAYPSLAVMYYSLNIPYGVFWGYEITHYMHVLSYDNTTGLPQTFVILVQHYFGTLSPGTYYLYVYYPSPYYFSYDSIYNFSYMPACPSNLSNITFFDFNGGWCTPGGGYGSYYVQNMSPMYAYPYSQSLYYYGCFGVCGIMINQYFTRYLYIKFNPAYPVFIATVNGGIAFITVMNPSTDNITTIGTPLGSLYDLRLLELQNGLDPNQWNEIVSVQQFADPIICGCGSTSLSGIYLQYIPET